MPPKRGPAFGPDSMSTRQQSMKTYMVKKAKHDTTSAKPGTIADDEILTQSNIKKEPGSSVESPLDTEPSAEPSAEPFARAEPGARAEP